MRQRLPSHRPKVKSLASKLRHCHVRPVNPVFLVIIFLLHGVERFRLHPARGHSVFALAAHLADSRLGLGGPSGPGRPVLCRGGGPGVQPRPRPALRLPPNGGAATGQLRAGGLQPCAGGRRHLRGTEGRRFLGCLGKGERDEDEPIGHETDLKK